MLLNDYFFENSTFSEDTLYANVIDGYKLARWFYKVGYPILEDPVYDSLHREFCSHEAFNFITSVHYEDDIFPKDSFNCFNIDSYEFQLEENKYKLKQNTTRLKQWEHELSDEESKSIYPVDSMSQALTWVGRNEGIDLIFSLKVDGINTNNLYNGSKGNLNHKVSVTRSRHGSGIDITDNLSKVIPSNLQVDESVHGSIFVRGEAFVPSKELPYLRDKYGQPYKIPRSTALSAIRTGFLEEDMHLLKVYVFKTGLGSTIEEGYLTAQELGFNIPPYEVARINLEDGNQAVKQINEIMQRLYDKSKELDIPSDGVVVQINETNLFKSKGDFGNYNHGAIALKFGYWASNVYRSKVLKIEIETIKEECSYRAIIEPTVVSSGVEVSAVNLFNADIMIKTGINIGSDITFEYKSESSVNLIY